MNCNLRCIFPVASVSLQWMVTFFVVTRMGTIISSGFLKGYETAQGEQGPIKATFVHSCTVGISVLICPVKCATDAHLCIYVCIKGTKPHDQSLPETEREKHGNITEFSKTKPQVCAIFTSLLQAYHKFTEKTAPFLRAQILGPPEPTKHLHSAAC